MGGAQAFSVGIGFLRAKAVALILGASGVGLIGIFNNFNNSVAALAGWGLSTAGVRTISNADEKNRGAKIASVRRFGGMLSQIALVLAILLFWPVGVITFGTDQYTLEMGIASLAIPCLVASMGWTAILQAAGDIRTLAKIQIMGALTALVIGIPAIYFLGTLGVAVSIVLASAVPSYVLWKVVKSLSPPISTGEDSGNLRELIQLGATLVFLGWAGQIAAYVVRLYIVRSVGLEAAGYYQAAFAISGSLPGFVFAAMGADFFPRIASAKTEEEASYLVEKQIQAGLLLGTPFIVILLSLGRQCIHLLYASSFDPAIPLLGWMTWGVFIRLISWPLGFWLLARRSPKTVIWVECIGNGLTVLLPLALVPSFGLVGAAIAFFVGTLVHLLVVIGIHCYTTGTLLGRSSFAWAASASAALIIAQVWASINSNTYAALIPAVLVGIYCAWKYRQIIQGT